MKSHRFVIIGAGFAGAATARALIRAGESDVLLVDREPVPAVHSSGRNAGMLRRATEDPTIARLAQEGADEIKRLGVPAWWNGSLLLGSPGVIPKEVGDHPAHRFISAEEACRLVPMLEGAALPAGDVLYTPDDGVVEIHALLQYYLDEVRQGGGTVLFGAAAKGPRVVDGRVVGVDFDDMTVRCEHLVVATGAWAGEWGRLGGIPIQITPTRRHLIATSHPLPDSQRGGRPWVWDLRGGYYFREESAGLLWSVCDETADQPGAAQADRCAPQWLAERVLPLLPRARELEPLKCWAGHRTFTADRRFLLGPDPRIDGWHWAVGLGGHGVTVSAAVGARVARAALGGDAIEPQLAARDAVLGTGEVASSTPEPTPAT